MQSLQQIPAPARTSSRRPGGRDEPRAARCFAPCACSPSCGGWGGTLPEAAARRRRRLLQGRCSQGVLHISHLLRCGRRRWTPRSSALRSETLPLHGAWPRCTRRRGAAPPCRRSPPSTHYLLRKLQRVIAVWCFKFQTERYGTLVWISDVHWEPRRAQPGLHCTARPEPLCRRTCRATWTRRCRGARLGDRVPCCRATAASCAPVASPRASHRWAPWWPRRWGPRCLRPRCARAARRGLARAVAMAVRPRLAAAPGRGPAFCGQWRGASAGGRSAPSPSSRRGGAGRVAPRLSSRARLAPWCSSGPARWPSSASRVRVW